MTPRRPESGEHEESSNAGGACDAGTRLEALAVGQVSLDSVMAWRYSLRLKQFDVLCRPEKACSVDMGLHYPGKAMREGTMNSMAATAGTAELCARAVMETVPLMTRFIRAELRSRWAPSLSVPQFHVLALLNREPGSSLSNVADHLGVTRSTASVVVDRLVRRKLVRRTEHPQERRCVVLSLTAIGSQHFLQARDAACAQMASVLGKLSAADLRQITDDLNMLGSAFEDVMPWRSG